MVIFLHLTLTRLALLRFISIKDLICINEYLNASIWRLKRKKNYRDIVLINILDNIIQSLLKISLIWCNKLKCNFKYIYILPQKSIFILINKFCKKKKNYNRCGGLRSPKRLGWGKAIFFLPCPQAERGKTKPCRAEVKTLSFNATLPHCHQSWQTFNVHLDSFLTFSTYISSQ